ncbi:YoaK family protein [Bacillus sp. CLL-7-23]|uniref:YoaK family protein n=2 Tax=Bacillus changyiensis TaxID=3004103 RepID=A0ABT4X105_9BACI|nr:YoaK family protein [Bacillus changyiensis]MDA7025767.1 YoaK family protein [Bacillus changyiensis]
MVLLLCLTAGIVDVIGYLSIGHVFTANMTGNIIFLGLAIGHSLQKRVMYSLTALLSFIIGVVIAAIIVWKQEKSLWPFAITKTLAVEGFVLLLFACLSLFHPSPYLLIMLLSIAMGLQTIAARKLNIAGISTTVLTGTLASFFEDIMKRFCSNSNKKNFQSDALLRAFAIVLYCLGAIIAAFTKPAFPFVAIWLPILIIFGMIIVTEIMFQVENKREKKHFFKSKSM